VNAGSTPATIANTTARDGHPPRARRPLPDDTRLGTQPGQASGIAEVERAKADGRWEAAYAGPATARVPDDLAAALAAEPKAKTMFTRLTSQNRYAILHRIEAVKRPETRARKIAEFVAMLARGETVHPQTRRNEDQP